MLRRVAIACPQTKGEEGGGAYRGIVASRGKQIFKDGVEMINLEGDLYLDADQYQFFIKRRAVSEQGNVRFDMVGSYPTMATLIRGLSDSKLYELVQAHTSLKAVQDDFIAWGGSLKTPLVSELKEAVRAYGRENDSDQ